MRRRVGWSWSFVMLLLVAGRADGFSLDLEGGPHGAFNSIPLTGYVNHTQIVYSASLFPAGTYAVESLAFSPMNSGTVSGWLSIWLGPTASGVDALSSDLALNDTSMLAAAFLDATFSQPVTGGADSYSLLVALPAPVVYSTADGNFMAEFESDMDQTTFLSSSNFAAGDGGSRATNDSVLGNAADTDSPRIRLELTPLEFRPPGPHTDFAPAPLFTGDSRFQFVYGADWFPPEPIEITALALSPQSSGTVDADLEIRLGVTSVAVDALSEFLDDNVTSPLVTVLDDPSFSQAVTGGSESFSLRFALSTPFVYDPAEGNLLVEFLAANVVEDVLVSATDSSLDLASGAGDTSIGTFASTAALRVKLELAPEPGAAGAAAAAVGALGALARARTRGAR